MQDNTSKNGQDGVNSHIQMPKEVIKRFHNQYNLCCYYNVEGNFVGTKGTAESLNTEWGFYSGRAEHYLGEKVETPFGKVLAYIDSLDFSQNSVLVNSDCEETIRDFMYSLISRDPVFMQEMGTVGSILSCLPKQMQHDYVAVNGYSAIKRNGFLSDYLLTFLINETEIPFILPIGGLYSYSYKGSIAINLPISKSMALCLIHKNLVNVMVKNGAVIMLSISDPDIMMDMNSRAFRMQKQRGWGYVICPEREELDRLKTLYNNLD
jgi:hypothetical protein